MRITADLAAGKLVLPDGTFSISNRVRTLRDGTRESSGVVRSIPDGLPYDPRPFPKGRWRVTGIEWQRDRGFDRRTYGPVKIRTDAWQWVKVWELDAEGDYLRETDRQVRDTCYWLHYSEFGTTLGCIRLDNPVDAAGMAEAIAGALKGGPVELEVL
jgi:hypothetical protein